MDYKLKISRAMPRNILLLAPLTLFLLFFTFCILLRDLAEAVFIDRSGVHAFVARNSFLIVLETFKALTRKIIGLSHRLFSSVNTLCCILAIISDVKI